MRIVKSRAVVDLVGRQWQLLGLAGVIGAIATFYAARLVRPYLIEEQRQLWGPLEPFSFIRERYVLLSAVQLAFGLSALVCSRALAARKAWGRVGLIALSLVALLGSAAFGTLCLLAARGREPIDGPAVLSSGLYVLCSVCFYLTSVVVLVDDGLPSDPKEVAQIRGQPNNRLKLAARGRPVADW